MNNPVRMPGYGASQTAQTDAGLRAHMLGVFRNMGIGLTVCRTIVNAHGGQITAANRPQGGASFCITLPLAEIEEEEHDE